MARPLKQPAPRLVGSALLIALVAYVVADISSRHALPRQWIMVGALVLFLTHLVREFQAHGLNILNTFGGVLALILGAAGIPLAAYKVLPHGPFLKGDVAACPRVSRDARFVGHGLT